MQIKSFADVLSALQNGPYAWPGGYPLFFITKDGSALSFAGAAACLNIIEAAMEGDDYAAPIRKVVAVEVNWEDDSLFCCETGKQIEAAYID